MTINQKTKSVATEGKIIRLHTTKEISLVWNISQKRIRQLVHEGRIKPVVNLGGWRFTGCELEGVLERL